MNNVKNTHNLSFNIYKNKNKITFKFDTYRNTKESLKKLRQLKGLNLNLKKKIRIKLINIVDLLKKLNKKNNVELIIKNLKKVNVKTKKKYKSKKNSSRKCKYYKTENKHVFKKICLNNVSKAELKGSGIYNLHFMKGKYVCACCGNNLYNSEHKFDSGSGWPAFYDVYGKKSVNYNIMNKEISCMKCGLHLGHRFNPKRKHHKFHDCINSTCLNFIML